jgi:hypothetical protein
MHRHLQEVAAGIERSTSELRAAVAAVPPDLRRRKPAPERWSTAEIVEHLALVCTLFTSRLSGPLAAAREAGLGPEQGILRPVPERIAAAMANRRSTRPAPDPARPTGTIDDATAMAALERAHRTFLDLLESADGLALSSVTYDHPFFGTLDIYQWGELLARHELRHVDQIREIAEQFAASGG